MSDWNNPYTITADDDGDWDVPDHWFTHSEDYGLVVDALIGQGDDAELVTIFAESADELREALEALDADYAEVRGYAEDDGTYAHGWDVVDELEALEEDEDEDWEDWEDEE